MAEPVTVAAEGSRGTTAIQGQGRCGTMGSTLRPLTGSEEFCDEQFRATPGVEGTKRCPLGSQNKFGGRQCWLGGAALGWTSSPAASSILSLLVLQRPRAAGTRPPHCPQHALGQVRAAGPRPPHCPQRALGQVRAAGMCPPHCPQRALGQVRATPGARTLASPGLLEAALVTSASPPDRVEKLGF